MARLNKVGIDYFPFNVDFFEDDKIQLIESEFGVKGGYIAIRLLCKIYKEGYYYKWGADECLLFTRSLGAEGVSKNLVENIIDRLATREFVNQTLLKQYGILTSRGIQERYFEATKRYKVVNAIEEYLLVNVTNYKNVNIERINVNINPEYDNTNQQKKREEKKREETISIIIKGEQKLLKHSLFQTLDILLNDESWIEVYLMNNGFHPSDKELFCDYLKSFFILEQDRGEIYKTEKDAKQHFVNWLRLILEEQAKKQAKQKQTGGGHSRNQSQPISKVGSMFDIVKELLHPQN